MRLEWVIQMALMEHSRLAETVGAIKQELLSQGGQPLVAEQ